MEQKFETVISGSFKLKPEIDELQEEFTDLNVIVLEPEKGWLYIPSQQPIVKPSAFRPLPSERYMSIFEIENRFLKALERSDFLYVFNPYRYIGLSTAFEIGYACALDKPIFSKESLGIHNFDHNLDVLTYLLEKVTVATPSDAAKTIRDLSES